MKRSAFLIIYFFNRKNLSLGHIGSTLTRVPEGTSFQDGIFPLNDALPSIWEMLYKLLSKKACRLLEGDGSKGG
ncbi:hypothetical protein RAS14_16490 [Achromobacter aegrifaciens]|uniref:hypothetical protein n=1 Tax=Achromobacter aegrifaciens TaxID=1287736 RepID=UPI0027946CF5|nr:hypothetical protein [Achromobacter aegrifaciens]MDQ1761366.1 hypothetical protein [Achromobacter aegrifaciens]